MKNLAELVLSLCALVEAEGGLLRENVIRVTRLCAIMIIGLFFAAAALWLLLTAAYAALILIWPKPVVLALGGLACALIAAGILWTTALKITASPVAKPKRESETP